MRGTILRGARGQSHPSDRPNNAMKLNQQAASRITQAGPIGLPETTGGDMKSLTGFLAAILLLLNAAEASAAIRIANDRGGQIGPYVRKYQRLASSGESVIIDGLCASA